MEDGPLDIRSSGPIQLEDALQSLWGEEHMAILVGAAVKLNHNARQPRMRSCFKERRQTNTTEDLCMRNMIITCLEYAHLESRNAACMNEDVKLTWPMIVCLSVAHGARRQPGTFGI